MPTVNTTFKLTFTEEQYRQARNYVEDMKKHKNRVYWVGKEGKSDEELILTQIAHRILSGFYNGYNGLFSSDLILDMSNKRINGDPV
jgi:hypothetical protein